MVGKATPGRAPAPKVKAFNCPSCGAGVTLRAEGHSVAVVCGSCSSVIDAADSNHQIIMKAMKAVRVQPLIPLGKRGKLHGALWEVIGYLQRSDGTGIYHWDEYLLFNPTKGFRWLMEFDGHWNFIVPIKGKPIAHRAGTITGKARTAVKYLDRVYYLFHQGQAKVQLVLGEFYWRVKVGETVKVADYVDPPEVLSSESDRKEIVWSLGEYIAAETVKAAFQIDKPMPWQKGVAPNQPSTVSSIFPGIAKAWLGFVAALVVLQIGVALTSSNDVVFRRMLEGSMPTVTEPFTVSEEMANLGFDLDTGVDNNWIGLDIDLVNDGTGEVREFEQGAEYYHGYDGGEYWSEGSRRSRVVLSLVPAGTYHLNIRPSGFTQRPYILTVRRDVVTWSNFWLALVLLTVVPAIVWWRTRSFEKSRWSTSDFSPYWSEDD